MSYIYGAHRAAGAVHGAGDRAPRAGPRACEAGTHVRAELALSGSSSSSCSRGPACLVAERDGQSSVVRVSAAFLPPRLV